MKRFWLTILTLSPLVTWAAEPTPSLHTAGNLRRSIDRYLADYRAWKNPAPTTQTGALPAQAAPLKLPTFEDELQGLLETQNYGERPVAALSRETLTRRNGGTLAERFAPKIGMLAQNLTQAPGETYNEIVAALLADYYTSPNDRDALIPLLRAIGDQLPVNPNYDISDPILDPMRQGTMVAYMFVVVWDWRGGAKGLAQDAQGFAAAAKRPLAFGSEKLAALFRKSVAGAGESTPLENAKKLGSGILKLRKNLDNPLKSSEGREKLLASLKTHAKQLGRSFLLGGVPAALVGANQVTEPARIHPMDAIDVIQAFAIADLELQIINLKARAKTLLDSYTDPKTKELLLAKARADAEKLRSFVAESHIQEMHDAFGHFTREAKKFNGQNEWPDLAQRLRNYRKPNLYYRRSARDRVADLVEASQELTDMIEDTSDRVVAAKANAGMTARDTLYVNLVPIQANLAATEAMIQAIQVLAGPAPKAKTTALPPKR